ncbi:MAG: YraN family protein [Chitinophagaceae bacterium]
MAFHISLGQKGEQLAVGYLIKNGYEILHRNWRHSHYEIDIIATKNGVLHFVEVKIRSSKNFGFPEDNVTKKKFQSLLNAADEFLFQHQQYKHVQYDVLSISVYKNEPTEIFLIEDVYL